MARWLAAGWEEVVMLGELARVGLPMWQRGAATPAGAATAARQARELVCLECRAEQWD